MERLTAQRVNGIKSGYWSAVRPSSGTTKLKFELIIIIGISKLIII